MLITELRALISEYTKRKWSSLNQRINWLNEYLAEKAREAATQVTYDGFIGWVKARKLNPDLGSLDTQINSLFGAGYINHSSNRVFDAFKIDDLTRQLAESAAARAAAIVRAEAAEATAEATARAAATARAEAAEATARAAETARAETAEARAEAATTARAEAAAGIATAVARVAAVEETFIEKDARIRALSSALQTASDENVAAKGRVDFVEASMARLQTILAALKTMLAQELNAMRAKLEAAKAEIIAVKADKLFEIKPIQDRIYYLMAELEAANARILTAELRVAALERELTSLRVAGDGLPGAVVDRDTPSTVHSAPSEEETLEVAASTTTAATSPSPLVVPPYTTVVFRGGDISFPSELESTSVAAHHALNTSSIPLALAPLLSQTGRRASVSLAPVAQAGMASGGADARVATTPTPEPAAVASSEGAVAARASFVSPVPPPPARSTVLSSPSSTAAMVALLSTASGVAEPPATPAPPAPVSAAVKEAFLRAAVPSAPLPPAAAAAAEVVVSAAAAAGGAGVTKDISREGLTGLLRTKGILSGGLEELETILASGKYSGVSFPYARLKCLLEMYFSSGSKVGGKIITSSMLQEPKLLAILSGDLGITGPMLNEIAANTRMRLTLGSNGPGLGKDMLVCAALSGNLEIFKQVVEKLSLRPTRSAYKQYIELATYTGVFGFADAMSSYLDAPSAGARASTATGGASGLFVPRGFSGTVSAPARAPAPAR